MQKSLTKQEKIEIEGKEYILDIIENKKKQELRIDVYYQGQKINRVNYICVLPKTTPELLEPQKIERLNKLKRMVIFALEEKNSSTFKIYSSKNTEGNLEDWQ